MATCQQRIRSHWAGRKADFTAYMDKPEVYDNGDNERGPFNEYGLAFDYVPAGTFTDQKRGFWRYQLSWGGPSDEIRFFGDPSGKVYKAEYRFMDWGDGAGLNVTDEPCVQWLIDFFQDIGSFKHALEQAERS